MAMFSLNNTLDQRVPKSPAESKQGKKVAKRRCRRRWKKIEYLKIVEYTSQRIPPVQYISIFVFSLSTVDKGSDAVT